MNKILLVVLIIAALLIALTVYQVADTLNITKDKELNEKVVNALGGDCSNYQSVIDKYNNVVSRMRFNCRNPVILFISSKDGGICEEIHDFDFETLGAAAKIREACE